MLEKISPFGPKIGKSLISNELHSLLLNAVEDPTSTTATNKLISYVKHERTVTDILNSSGASDLIKNYIIDYVNNIEPGIYEPILPLPKSAIVLQSAWVNIQQEHEFHPLHTHHGSDVVCVIFPSVNIVTPSIYATREDYKRKPGSLVLNYGHLLNYGVGSTEYVVDPKEKDIYIFPGDMNHYTLPIFGNDLRVSISCNFAFSENVKRKLSDFIKRKFK